MTKVGDYNALTNSPDKTFSSDPKINDIGVAVEKAVKTYDPEAEERDESLEFHETEAVPFCKMLTRFASGCDMTLAYIGFFWSFIFGGSMPGFCIIFGELVDDMG